MFDIIRCAAEPSRFGFERFFSLTDAKGKIIEADNVVAAAEQRNRKSLVILKDYAFDEGAIKLIAEKKSLCFLIDIGRLVRTRGVPRAIAMSKLRTFLAMCNRFGAYYSFATFAEKENEIRTPGEMEHIAMLLGINRGQAKFALRMLKHYL
jgi:RNase P/RNase MRP subunit p30